MNTQRFQNRVALVTGGGSGFGRAVALRLAGEGAAVAVLDINAKTGEETCELVGKAAGRAVFIEGDVTVAEDNERAVARATSEFGGLDVLFPSAGVGAGGTVLSTSEDEWDRVVNLDLRGVYLSCKYGIAAMIDSGGGAVVTVASIGGLRGNSGASFSAAKGGVVNLTRHMAVAHAAEGVRANCICPGWVETPINAAYLADAERRAKVVAAHPLGRLGTVDDVAAAVAFLASDEASWITGAILAIDGGYLARGP